MRKDVREEIALLMFLKIRFAVGDEYAIESKIFLIIFLTML
jgi:hypothetical protein